jgi:hypothetical protein
LIPLFCLACAPKPAANSEGSLGPACKPLADKDVYFEYQVNRPAVYIESDTKASHPVSSSASSVAKGTGLVAQFVVDTLGKPDPRSFKILRAPNDAAASAARDALSEWRFIPATAQGCKVPQLVQTELTIR